MPIKPPPVYKPNNALPVLPKMGLPVYRHNLTLPLQSKPIPRIGRPNKAQITPGSSAPLPIYRPISAALQRKTQPPSVYKPNNVLPVLPKVGASVFRQNPALQIQPKPILGRIYATHPRPIFQNSIDREGMISTGAKPGGRISSDTIQCAKLQIGNNTYPVEYNEQAFAELMNANLEAAKAQVALMILKAYKLDYEELLLNQIKDKLQKVHLEAVSNGHPISNSSLELFVERAKLTQDFSRIRPWLCDMYQMGSPESSIALALGTTKPEADQAVSLFNREAVHVKKNSKSSDISKAIERCLDTISGDMSVTIIGHIAYNNSTDPAEWTCAGLTVHGLTEALKLAVNSGVKEGAQFLQLNLLSCGCDLFARKLFQELVLSQCAPRIMTAIRDEIPITPGPMGDQKFKYLFAGDYENEKTKKDAQNILTTVHFVRDGRGHKTLYQHIFERMRKLLKSILLQDKLIDNVTRYMLPEPPSEGELNALRHH